MRVQTTLALLALSFLGSCGLPKAGFTPRYLTFDVEGDLLVSDTGASIAADVETMGFSKDSSSFAPRADFEWGAFEMTLAHSSTNHSGTGVADADLEFDEVSINAEDAIDTDFNLGLTELIMTWDLIPGDTVDFGIGFGATLADVDLTVASLDNPGIEYETDESLPIPMIAGRLAIELGDFNAEALVSGLSVDVDGDKATVIDMDLGLRYNLVDIGGQIMGALTLGYRSFDLALEYDDDGGEKVDIDIGFSGPYFGLSFWI
ncbi:MAG: hypothetical protein P8N31_00765 [Planctomycetota bacterium]|nr:hypothetical protein [Planctomycetota bacterium]